MPLRKSKTTGTAASALCAAVLASAAIPATADAGILSGLFSSKTKTTTTTTTKATSSGTPASSGTPCVALPTTKAFQRVDGDTADYSLAPGGDFEGASSGWTLKDGAKIVSGNETLGVSAGRQSLQLPLSGSAVSPPFCVDETKPHFRFAYKVDNAVLSGFVAYVVYRDAKGAVTDVELVSSKALTLSPSLWKATPASPLSTLLPLDNAGAVSVQLKIVALNPTDFVLDTSDAIIGQNVFTQLTHTIGSLGSNMVATTAGAVGSATNIGITIDSVMVDPYRRG